MSHDQPGWKQHSLSHYLKMSDEGKPNRCSECEGRLTEPEHYLCEDCYNFLNRNKISIPKPPPSFVGQVGESYEQRAYRRKYYPDTDSPDYTPNTVKTKNQNCTRPDCHIGIPHRHAK